MVAIQHLVGPAALSSAAATTASSSSSPTSSSLPPTPPASSLLSLMSYNVLLPNSVDGWWHYKMYLPPLSEETLEWSTWEYRKGLLKDRIAAVDADVVCLQEVSPVSFDSDFDFMGELGYGKCEMFKKGRFRPATFWKPSKLELVAPPVHKDRTLLTAFRHRQPDDDDDDNDLGPSLAVETDDKEPSSSPSSRRRITWYVLNCHLQAGKEGPRRVRQINEGVRSALTLARKLKERNPERHIPLIVCGDFNGGSECGAIRYLEDGFVDSNFREDGDHVTASLKSLPLERPLRDVAAAAAVDRNNTANDDSAAGDGLVPPPATLVVPELISLLVEGGHAAYENPRLSTEAKDRLRRIFDRFATTQPAATKMDGTQRVMNVDDAERWLVTINRALGRGSEFREAARKMGWKGGGKKSNDEDDRPTQLPRGGRLSLQDFVDIYESELRAGKFWGIAHDLAVLGEALPDAGIFESRYDRIYCSDAAQPVAVVDFVCHVPCPNRDEPSDHLPIAASFTIARTL